MAIWKAQRTLLIVGEGRHEEAFLNHVKQLYAPRGCGLSVTIKNARGKAPAMRAGACKQQLAPYVNHDPTQRQNYVQHFGAACLEAGREHEPTIDALLRLMGK